MAKVWMSRTVVPATTNKYYLKTTHGGYNRCILGNADKGRPVAGSVLPNCTGYAYGRFMEVGGEAAGGIKSCKLPTNNAEDWYLDTTAYTKSKTPSLGAIACWSLGDTHDGYDGCGHVAIVEGINRDANGNIKSILISESGWSSFFFRTQTLVNKNGTYPYGDSALKFQGFIKNPWESYNYKEDSTPDPTPTPTPTPEPTPPAEKVVYTYDEPHGYIQSGNVEFRMSNDDGNVTLKAQITFKQPFTKTPRIVTDVNTSGFTSESHFYNVTKNGFVLTLKRSDPARTAVNWCAFGD